MAVRKTACALAAALEGSSAASTVSRSSSDGDRSGVTTGHDIAYTYFVSIHMVPLVPRGPEKVRYERSSDPV